jgi:Flp pilus assembly protein TadD
MFPGNRSMKIFVAITIGLLLLVGGGCARKKKEITSLERKEAAALASEANLAVTLRDLPRAEKSLAKATELCPDDGELWVGLGSIRMRLSDRSGAKRAYESALTAFQDAATAKANQLEAVAWLNQVHVLALLGKTDDARKVLEKAQKQFPENRDVRVFVQERELDQMMASPAFKEMAL